MAVCLNPLIVRAETDTNSSTSFYQDDFIGESMEAFDRNIEYYRSLYLNSEQIDMQIETFLDENSDSSRSIIDEIAINIYFDYYRYLSARDRLTDGRFIELILDLNQDLSVFTCFVASRIAVNAQNIGEESGYPGRIDGEQDAYRHFIWNYMLAEEFGKNTARILTCNHEWGNLFHSLENAQTYFDNRYSIYIQSGYEEDEAEKLAYDDAIVFIPYSKDLFISTFTTFAKFQEIWDKNSYYMDFNNNCYGRAYGDVAAYNSYHDAYLAAKNAGELILSKEPEDCTYDKKWCIWGWDWYSGYLPDE